PQSFESAAHGAGRRMSRGEAKRRFSVRDLMAQTKGVECRKDGGVLDEIPAAYKSIEQVMENQKDLVEVVAERRQVLCVRGGIKSGWTSDTAVTRSVRNCVPERTRCGARRGNPAVRKGLGGWHRGCSS